MSDQIVLLTQQKYDEIVAEHDELVSVRRREVAERIKEALSYGDISENAEYDAAKNEQADLEEQIYKLENMMRKAKIIDESEIDTNTVSVGRKVKVQEMKSKTEFEYTIVGTTEADPFDGKLSNESPVGAGLLGKRVGEKVEIPTPDGTVTYKVVSLG